jgi:ribosome-associated protein
MNISSFSSRLDKEINFSVSRSSGPGGQNVNKVNSKVTLKFDVRNSLLLTDDEKEILLHKLTPKLTASGVLILTSQDSRSQLENKETVIQKFNQVLAKAFEKKKARKATKPSKSSVQKRVNQKKQHAEKKQWRKKL